MKTYHLGDLQSGRLKYDGNLYLYGKKIDTLPEGLVVEGWLILSYTLIKQLPEHLTVYGSLYLDHTLVKELPEDLIVGGWLDLSYTQIEQLPDSLIVGDTLYISHTPISHLPQDLSVGYKVYMDNTNIQNPSEEKSHIHYLKDGEYVPGRYLYADGILTHVRKSKKVGDYTYYVGKIKGRNVVSDGTYYAHCDKFRDGIADLLFKAAKDRGADQYKNLTLDSVVSTDDAITMYRVITGACRPGTQTFVDSLGELKEAYTIQEIIHLTDGRYGSENFRRFFEK